MPLHGPLRPALTALLILLSLLSGAARAQVSLTLGDTTLSPGDSGSITAAIATDGSAVALQFDVLYDPAVLTLGTVSGGAALTGDHSIASSPISPGRDRIVVTTAPVTALGAGVLATINLAVLASAGAGTTPLTFGGVVISDASALPITPSSLVPGSVTVLAGGPPPPPPSGGSGSPPPVAIPALPLWGLGALIALVLSAAGLAGRRTLKAVLPLAVALLVLTPEVPRAQTLPGDANGDGVIDAEDVRLIVERILERGVLPGDGDCNRDGTINVLDTVCSQLPFVPGETAPIILGPGDRSIVAEVAFEMNLFAADPDAGATLSWELLGGPAGLAVSADGVLTWTPGTGAAGPNPVSVRVTDDTARSAEASFSINVTVLPPAPLANAAPRLTVPDDLVLPVGTPLAAASSATDPDPGDTLTYALIDGPAGMTIDAGTGALSWTPGADQAGRADVVIQVTDAAGASDFGSFIVEATPLNAAPVAVDDVYIARKGETLIIPALEGVIQNDTDPNDDALGATRLSDPTLGTIDSFNANGSFSYTPGEPSGITIGLQLKCETSLSDFVTSAGTASAADVDNDGDVELVGMSYFGLGAGVFVVDPTDCSAVASRIPFDSGQPLSDAVVTLVNLDDDPELEVVATYFRFGVDLVGSADFGEDDNRLMAFELDGTPVAGWPRHGVSHKPAFDTGFNAEWKQASPVAADLNGDGTPELLMGYTQVGSSGLPEGICRAVVANTTCNAVVAWDGRTGTVLWTYIGGVTGPNQRSMTPTIVDLDMDGDTEIIWNQLVLDHEGNLVFELPVERTILVAGFELYGNAMFTSAIGNFDNDAFPEIVGYDDRNFYLFSHDGGIQWQRPYNGGGFDFPWADLTLAELDGDPFPELVTMITGPDDAILTLRAFDSDGEPLWDQADDYAVRGFAQTRTSSAVAIDLDRDGIDELIQFKTLNPSSDVSGLYIIDGATGSIIDSIVDPALGVSNDRGDEPLTVADLDGDGSVEIVTNFNREFGFDRLNIWDNLPGEPFPPGRPIRSQTNVQPTWVNVDGSLPTSLEPHWLQPGRNYWNRIVPDLDPLAPEEDSFAYRVSDGEFDSAPATVNIEVRPNGNPPFFLSDPDDATSAGIAYRYQPLVVDVDPGDSFTFELLNGPAGMTIDPASGALDWYPEANGDFPVSIAVTDTLGLSAAQIFTLAVGDPVEVPDVVGQTEAGAESTLTGAGLLLGSRLRRSDPAVPAGQVLAQEPPAGAVADLGASVRLTLSSGPSALDTDGDGDGFTPNEGDCNDDDNTIYPAAPEIDGDGIDQSCNGIDGDKILASIEVTPESKRLITGEPQPMRALGIFEDGTAQDLTGVVAWTRGPTFFSADAGSFTAEATLDGVTGSAAFTVLERVDEDAAPVARILTPGNGDTLTAPTTVTGTVFDVNVVRWELAYQYAGEDDFVTFAEGASTRSAAPLGDFDPTTLLNGLYTIRLQVFDAGGNVSEDSTTVQVEGQMKVGPFSINYVDLEIPMSGVPIAVERVYDSRDKRRGDLGVGWRLGINSLEVRTTENLGREWQVIRSGLSYRIVETQVHRASVRLPDGRIEAFQMVVSPSASPIIPFPPFTQAVSFRPLPGTLGTLESLEENTVSILDAQPGPVELRVDSDGSLYAPSRFRYTTVSGVQIELNTRDGVERIVDRNGNTLTFADDGITHSGGKSVRFDRDAQGRITAITDPRGNVQTYRYDANGDLRSHTDAEGFTTRYDYNRFHDLIRITDPLDRVVARNEYDDAGRLIRAVNENGAVTEYTYDVAGREQRVTQAGGGETLLEYDERGNIVRTTDALGNTVERTFDAQDNLTSITNTLGETITRSYDGRRNLLSETDAEGNTVAYTYDARNQVTSRTDALGHTTDYEYDARGNLVRQTDPLGNSTVNTFSETGLLLAQQDALGRTNRFGYDSFGNEVTRTDAAGNTERRAYDGNGYVISVTDRRGLETRYTRDARGLVTAIETPLGDVFSFSYDAAGTIESRTDALGNTERYEVDAFGRSLAFVDADGARRERRYDANGDLIASTDALGRTTSLARDLNGRLTQITFASGASSVATYDAAGRLVSHADGNGQVSVFTYDGNGRRTRRIDALGNETREQYDAAGNLVRLVDAEGNTFEFTYDDLNRQTQVTLPDGTIRTQAFNAVGEVISSTDALGRETRYEYDAKGNLAAVVDPLGGTTRYAYDAEDNLVRQADANGNVTRFVYDENGRMTQRIYPDGSTESQTYDAAGRVATMTGPDGGVTTLEYDAVGRVLRKTFPDASTESFTYSPSGRMLTATNSAGTVVFEYDDLDRLRRLENVDGSVITYTYDAAGNRISESVRLAGSVVATVTSYAYDAMNRLSSITDADGGVTSLTYDAIGNMVSRTLPNGVRTEYSFDPNSRLTRLTHGSAPLMLADYVYDLNAVGDRVRVTETVSGESAEYAYDPLRRLVSESYFDDRSVKVFELSYEYDAVGNRTALTDSAGTRTTYRYDNADKLLSQGAINYEYDASGNLRVARSPSAAARFTFDQEDQLIRVLRDGRETGYTYDARGERIRRVSGGTTTNYLVDPVSLTGYSQVLADYTIAGGETRYTFGLERVSRDDGVPQYFHADASRNVRLLTDSTGTVTDRYDYQAFGQLRRASGASPNLYGFAGEHFDPEADLTYLRARYYDPVLGRFVSRDPFAGMPDEPMSLHRYLYAYANPLLFTDPSGEVVVTATGLAIASAIAGTIAGVVMAANSLYQAYGATAGFTDDRRARTDEFRVRFCSGATVAAGLGGGALTASIAEIGTKNPESSTYNLSVFGVGGAIGAATGGGEVRFDTPTPKNVKSFAGLGEIRTIGAGVGGIAGAAYDLYRIPNAGTEWVENVTKPGIGDSVSGLGLGAGGIVGWAYWSPRSLNDAIDKYTFRLNCPVAID